MGLINGNNDIKAKFIHEWSSKYVPAILSYAENSSRKSVYNHFKSMNVGGKSICNVLHDTHVILPC